VTSQSGDALGGGKELAAVGAVCVARPSVVRKDVRGEGEEAGADEAGRRHYTHGGHPVRSGSGGESVEVHDDRIGV
jgi:hypothetical protein